MIKQVICWALLLVLIGVVALVFFNRRFVIGLWQYGGQARDGTLAVGDAAPGITLWELDGRTSQSLDERFGTKPLVLVFGSFT